MWRWRSPRAKRAGRHWCTVPAHPPQHHTHASQGNTHLHQTARGVSLSGLAHVEAPLTRFGVGGFRWLCLFFTFIHFLLPFLHHRGASSRCSPPPSVCVCGKKQGSQSDHVQVPSRSESGPSSPVALQTRRSSAITGCSEAASPGS